MAIEILSVNKRMLYYLTNDICTACGGSAFPRMTNTIKRNYRYGKYNHKVYRKFCKKCKKVCKECACL